MVDPDTGPQVGVPTSRRALLTGAAAGLGGFAVGHAVGGSSPAAASSRSGSASPTQQELRDNVHRGSFGIWPIIWSVPVAENAVALTFDDGPDPEFTPKVLAALKQYGAKATFMMIGWNCVHHPDLVKRVVGDGHEVGNHTWSHLDLALSDPATARTEMHRGREAVEQTSGQKVRFFRPPRGELSGVAALYAAEAQQSILMWSVDGGAHKEKTVEQVHDHLVDAIRPGYIVDFHDGIGRATFNRTSRSALALIRQRTLEIAALPGILETLTARGIRFVTMSDLLDSSVGSHGEGVIADRAEGEPA